MRVTGSGRRASHPRPCGSTPCSPTANAARWSDRAATSRSCARPRWHDDAVFSSLLGGAGGYAVTPADDRFVWGGHYEQDTPDLAQPLGRHHAVHRVPRGARLPRRAGPGRAAPSGRGHRRGAPTSRSSSTCRAEFGARAMTVRRSAGRRLGGPHRRPALPVVRRAPARPRSVDGRLGRSTSTSPRAATTTWCWRSRASALPATPPDPDRAVAPHRAGLAPTPVPDLDASVAPGESRHSYAVLRGLTSVDRRHGRRRHDLAARARRPGPQLRLPLRLDPRPVLRRAGRRRRRRPRPARRRGRFVSDRVLEDGPHLRPAYTVDGGPVPDERRLRLPGYPGAPVRVGQPGQQAVPARRAR